MRLTRKRLRKITILALITTLLIRLISVVSILGIYGCTTDQCLQHDAGHAKLTAISALNYLAAAVFLLSLAFYIVYVIRKKP